jgi:hypothetical protein
MGGGMNTDVTVRRSASRFAPLPNIVASDSRDTSEQQAGPL